MKKLLLFSIISLFTINMSYADKVIPTLEDGTILRCDATKSSGTIKEYTSFTDFYEVKDGKIYSQNLSKMFGNPNYKKKVMKLKITEDTISFKDRLYRWKASYYKWVTIDRNTGKYTFKAKRERTGCGGYYQTAKGTGQCQVIVK
jgi:hypothetical protein